MFRRRTVKQLGTIVIALGAGVILAVLIPYWGWLIAVGGAIIVLGWIILTKCC